MTDKRKAFAPITDDIDSRIEAMARAKGVPSLTAPEAVTPLHSGSARELAHRAGERPLVLTPSPEETRDHVASVPKTKVTSVKSFVPDYAYLEIKLRAAHERVSVNHIVLKALHEAGFHIKPEDMIEDGRRLRGSRAHPQSAEPRATVLRRQVMI